MRHFRTGGAVDRFELVIVQNMKYVATGTNGHSICFLHVFKLYYYAIYCVIKLCKLSMLTNAHTCNYQGYNILDTAWISRF